MGIKDFAVLPFSHLAYKKLRKDKKAKNVKKE